MGQIGEPRREIVVVPEREPVPGPLVPDSPEGLPEREPQEVPA